jgi:hypothetical protein
LLSQNAFIFGKDGSQNAPGQDCRGDG